MRSKHMNLLAAWVVFLASSVALAAGGAPPLLPFQGRMTNSSGNPINTLSTVKFRIYPPTGTCYIYEETQSILPSTQGIFSTNIGGGLSTGPANTFSQIFSNDPANVINTNCGATTYTPNTNDYRRLEVEVDGVVMADMQTIGSSAFAVNSNLLEGRTASQFIQTSTNVTQANVETLVAGSGTDASTLHNHDSMYARRDGSGGGFSGSISTTASIYAPSATGSIGVGTSTTAADVHIAKTAPSILLQSASGGGGTSKIDFYGGNTQRASIQVNEATSGLTIQSGTITALSIDNAANVDIFGHLRVIGTVGVGQYNNAAESTLITSLTTLGTAARGKMWVNTQDNSLKYWDGSAVQVISAASGVVQSVTAGTGLTDSGTPNDPILNVAYGTATGTAIQGNATFAGDVSGNYWNLSVDRIKGTAVDFSTAPTAGQILMYTTAGGGKFIPQNVPAVGMTTLNGLTAQSQSLAVGTIGTAPNWVSTGTTHTLHIPYAGAAGVTAGYLSKTDWDVFNNKQDALGYVPLNIAGGSMTGPLYLSANPTATLGSATKQYVDSAIATAAGAYVLVDGSQAFTANQSMGGNSLTNIGGLVINDGAGTKNVTLRGPATLTNAYVLRFPLDLPATPGMVLSSDTSGNLGWSAGLTNTLNSAHMFVGNGSNVASAVLMSGDATMSNAGVVTIEPLAVTTGKIAANAVTNAKLATDAVATGNVQGGAITFAKMQNVNTNRLLGRSTAGAGYVEELSLGGPLALSAGTLGVNIGAGLTISNGTLTASGSGFSLNSAQILVGNASNVATAVTATGDVSISNTGATTISANAVTTAKIADANVTNAKLASNAVATTNVIDDAITYTKLQNVTGSRILGRWTGTDGNAEEIQIGPGLTLASGSLTASGSGFALASNSILIGNGSGVATAVLTSGDATINNTGSITVVSVGGSSAANVNTATVAANSATSANTANTIVKRDALGNFSAGTLTQTASTYRDTGSNTATVKAPATLANTYTLMLPTDLPAAGGMVLTGDTNGQLSWGAGLTNSLAQHKILVGNSSGIAAAVSTSGDATIADSGAITITTGAVTNSKLATDAVATGNIIADAVTFAKIQNVNTNRLLGRSSASAGDIEELSIAGPLALSAGTLGVNIGAGLTISNGTLAVSGSGFSLNSAQILVGNASNVATAVTATGDVSISNTGATSIASSAVTTAKIADANVTNAKLASNAVATANVIDDAISYAKLQNVTGSRILGRWTGTDGDAQEIQIGPGLTLASGSLSASGSGFSLATGNILVGNGSGVAAAVTMTGDVTMSSSGNTVIGALAVDTGKLAANAVTNAKLATDAVATANVQGGAITFAKMQNVNTNRLLGRSTAGAGYVEELSLGGPFVLSAGTLGVNIGAGLTISNGTLSASGSGFSLNSAQILVGNASNVATAVTATGDVSISNTGATSIASSAVTTAKIADANVTNAKLASNAVATTNVIDDAITYAKLQNVTGSRILGRWTGTDGDAQEIQIGPGLSLSGGSLSASGSGFALATGNILVGNGSGVAAAVTMSGDVTISSSGNTVIGALAVDTGKLAANAVTNAKLATDAVGTTNVIDDAVTFAKMQNINSGVLVGRSTASAGDMEQITIGTGLTLSGGSLYNSAITSVVGSVLNNGRIWVGNASNQATEVVMSGDVTIGNTGITYLLDNAVTSTKINAGAVTNAKLATDAVATGNVQGGAITFAKMQNVNTNRLLGRSTAGSGYVEELTLATPFSLAAGTLGLNIGTGLSLTNGTLTASGAGFALNSSQILLGNASNVATAVSVTGDVTIGNTGITYLTDNAVTSAKINANAVTNAKLANDAVGTTNIIDDAITYAKMQNVTGQRLLGRWTATDGNAEEITIGTGLTLSGGSLFNSAITSVTGSALNSGRMWVGDASNAAQAVVLTGDVTIGNTGITYLADNAVTSAKINAGAVTNAKLANDAVGTTNVINDAITFAKMQNVNSGVLVGRSTAAAGDMEQIAIGTGLTLSGGSLYSSAVTTVTGSSLNTGRIWVGDGSNAAQAVILTGDVTIGNTGITYLTDNAVTNAKLASSAVATTNIIDDAITYAKMQNVTGQRLLGRWTATDGNAEEITIGTGLTLSGGSLYSSAVTTVTGSSLNSGRMWVGDASNAAQAVVLTGDVTIGNTGITYLTDNAVTSAKINANAVTNAKLANDAVGTTNVIDDAVTFAKMQNVNSGVLVGRSTAAAGDMEQITIGTGLTLSGGSLYNSAITSVTGSALNSGRIWVGDGSNAAQAVTLTGDVTIGNTGITYLLDNAVTSAKINAGAVTNAKLANDAVGTTNIIADAVTYAKMQNVTGSRLLGRWSSTDGDAEEIRLGAGLSFASGSLTNTGTGFALNSSQILVGNASNVATAVTATGDVSISNTGATTISPNAVTTAKIADANVTNAKLANDAVGTTNIIADAVTYAKLQNITGSRLLGRWTSTDGDAEEIRVGPGLSFASGSLTNTGTGFGLTATQILVGNASNVAAAVTMTGDVTISNTGNTAVTANAISTTEILNGTILYADIQNVSATNRILGRTTAGAGSMEELTTGVGLTMGGGSISVSTVPVANGGTGTTNGSITGTGALTFTAAAGSNLSLTTSAGGMVLMSGGTLGVGTATPQQALDVNGTVRATNLLLTSDRRAKSSITTLDGAESLEKMCRVNPVSFKWKKDGKPDKGVIAQELREIFPEMVDEASDGSLSVRYQSLISPLISSVQELNKRNKQLRTEADDLKSKVTTLKTENDALKGRVEKMERETASVKAELEEIKALLKAQQKRK